MWGESDLFITGTDIVLYCSTLYRYWRNTTIFPFTKKSFPCTSCEDTIFIFHMWGYFCAMVTNMISQLQESFLLRRMASSFEILCRYFISVYKISRTLHGHLGIWILSSSAESISHLFASLTPERYFQHSKIKFVSLCGHVISFLYIYIYIYIVVYCLLRPWQMF